MKTALLLLFPLLLVNCATAPDPETMTDSEKIFETLSTSSEFKDMAILLCLDKDCLTVDRSRPKPATKRRVIGNEEDREN